MSLALGRCPQTRWPVGGEAFQAQGMSELREGLFLAGLQDVGGGGGMGIGWEGSLGPECQPSEFRIHWRSIEWAEWAVRAHLAEWPALRMRLPRRGWDSHPPSQMSLEARPQSEPLACGHRKQLVLIVIE